MIEANLLIFALIFCIITIAFYALSSRLQQNYQLIWLNPMLITILLIVPILLLTNISYAQYYQATETLSLLTEPAIVALGSPLYQQLKQIKYQWRQIIALLALGVVIVLSVSFALTMLWIHQEKLAIALSLKSVTTPIGIALTKQFSADSSITAFAIIIAGLAGGLLGQNWLKLFGVHSAQAQGLAIGAASHVIGTAVLAKVSPQHTAYSSVALIFSALLTALLTPLLLPILIGFYQ